VWESQRRELHGRIADALAAAFPERAAAEPDQVRFRTSLARRAEVLAPDDGLDQANATRA